MLLALVIILLLVRWSQWSEALWTNVGLVEINHIPTWRVIDVRREPAPKRASEWRLKQALRISKRDPALWRGWGLSQLAHGNVDSAIKAWHVAGIEPAQVAVTQGYYAKLVGEADLALKWFEFAVEMNPHLADVWHEIGMLHEKRHAVEPAKEAYAAAVDLGHTLSVDPLAELWRQEGNFDAAVETWSAALGAFPGNSERLRWWYGVANSLRATEQWEQLLELVPNALQEFPSSARLHTELAYALFYTGSGSEAAMGAIARAIQLEPSLAFAYGTAGDILVADERFGEAVSWYAETIRRDPDNRSWELKRAVAARASGNSALALQLFSDITMRHPEWSLAHYQSALAYQQSGDLERAKHAIDQALALSSAPNSNYFVRAGLIYEASGDEEKASTFYEEALVLDNNNDVALERLRGLVDE